MEQTKLVKLILEEISGVGEAYGSGPASGLEGWMVTKAAGTSGSDEATWLTNLLNLIGEGGVECDPVTKAHYVERANALIAESETAKARHALRHDGGVTGGGNAGGKFRRIEPQDLHDGDTIKDAHGFVHSGAIHARLRALLTGKPHDAI